MFTVTLIPNYDVGALAVPYADVVLVLYCSSPMYVGSLYCILISSFINTNNEFLLNIHVVSMVDIHVKVSVYIVPSLHFSMLVCLGICGVILLYGGVI